MNKIFVNLRRKIGFHTLTQPTAISILLIIITASLALFFRSSELPPLYTWSDESEIAADAVDTLKNGAQLFYPGQLAGGSLAVWLEAGWMAIAGKGLSGLRTLNGLINIASALMLYLLVRQIPLTKKSNKQLTALTAALLLAVSTWVLGLGRIATPNWSLVPLMTTLSFYCFWRGLNDKRPHYMWVAGAVMGLLFYGYIPGYFVPLVLLIFLAMTIKQPDYRVLPIFPYFLLPALIMLIIAAPILIFFGLNPSATLQRPLQLANTNELNITGSMIQGGADMLSTYGILPNWLIQGRFEHLAFDPLVTVLFVVGLFLTLRQWRKPGYLFLLLWWAVMIAPALLSRSASQGFIFEVWRRGVGSQPVSFIFAALAVEWASRKLTASSARRLMLSFVVVIISASLSYWLYFVRWANSPVIPSLFAEAPVRMVEWMEADNQTGIFIFPVRPNVSPTTRPELFTVRYLYEGQADTAFPALDEAVINQTISDLLDGRQDTVTVFLSDRIAVDPKGYFEYALSQRGRVIFQERLPDYAVTTYQLRSLDTANTRPKPLNITFGDILRLTSQQIQPEQISTGRTLGVALRWTADRADEADYNSSIALYDLHGYEIVKVDKPLLSENNYMSTSHWQPGLESTLYYALPIPPDTPPGLYTIRVVAYNSASGERLPPLGGQADLSLMLAEIALSPNQEMTKLEVLAISQPLDVEFPNGLKLAGVDSSATSPSRPGDRVRVTLMWQAAKPLSQDIGLMLALALPGGEPVPLFNRLEPLITDYPTTAWTNGQTYKVNYSVLLPATLSSDEYILALRLFDLDTAETVAEQLLMPISVKARTHIFETTPLAKQLNIDFGRAVRLMGFESGKAILPGQKMVIKLQWQALAKMTESYKLFLHLTDESGRVVSQVDSLPQQGNAPTTGWVVGEIIKDELKLDVPSELPPGTYRLVAGLYNERSGKRLTTGEGDTVLLVEGIEVR